MTWCFLENTIQDVELFSEKVLIETFIWKRSVTKQEHLYTPTLHQYRTIFTQIWSFLYLFCAAVFISSGFSHCTHFSKFNVFVLAFWSSGVVKVSCVAAVVVVSDQHFSVLIGPEAVEVDQDASDGVALATVHQILQRDLIGVFRLHHVEDLILRRKSDENIQPSKVPIR